MGDTEASGLWPRDAASWASIPTELLLAELSKRHGHAVANAEVAGAAAAAAAADAAKPQCGSSRKESYDTALHIGALILILALSTICSPTHTEAMMAHWGGSPFAISKPTACGIPLLPRRTSKGRPQSIILFYCQHFGTGVLLATSFVHLLPTAFTSLTDPCLPFIFNQGYPQMAGLVAMVAALSVVALESYLATRGAGHSHSHSHEYEYWDEEDSAESTADRHATGSMASHRHGSHRPEDINLDNMESTQGLMAGASPLPSSTPTQAEANNSLANGRDSFDDDASDIDLDVNELNPTSADEPRRQSSPGSRPKITVMPDAPQVVTEEEQTKLLRQCLLLEGGILFHSIFIGMAISVATGPTFIVFLIAISFHQTFEGLALGSRIAAIQLPRSSLRPWLMVLAFGGTTPLGQLIGLIVHNLYDPMSQTGLLMVGFMNSISAGLLLFAGLVQLLAEDFLSEKSYKILQGRKRLNAYMAVIGGASLMAIVGAFA
ncbi:zinc-regulated transporter 2 [Colletotrichum spaethianum]|uniref:Zinc-regulated transporter 2 n=1 Tax=Colletotrichum spaethianum TaxID=700344 RepID=A0AA37LBK0_9PEZI|nr:zinc-regulated transporter 2 [Colletotrichum spaethianum]GKT42955.1 zinc-regulated transporter 2 [Colletotrichum spaethianum]